ncbi:MAG TPA: hypothetical protein VHC91_02090 [Trinickia sp.]|uniref:hypothetical protein n=1 Tax=Trinickia sp. TaxID=2571163 RepID=UPI002BD3C4AD|nr:hypothetical protein [Trinickia sp.]HVW49181.1 hypothetical protein [Trinickia sp.]
MKKMKIRRIILCCSVAVIELAALNFAHAAPDAITVLAARPFSEAEQYFKDSGYTVTKIDSSDGMSYEMDVSDKSKDYLNGSMTLCKGLVATVNRGLEPDTYPLVLNRLFKTFGQPKARIGTFYTKQGAMSYATLVWDVGSTEISLSDMPSNDAIAGMASHRDVRLGFDDMSQSCFYDVRRDPAIQTRMAPRNPMTFSMP